MTYIGSRRGSYYKAWTPDKLGSGLYLWLDGTDRSTLTSVSSKITAWRDKSVYGNHLAQSNTSQQPVDTGTPAVLNSSGLLTSINANPVLPLGAQDRTVFLVASTYSGRSGVTGHIINYGGSNGFGVGLYEYGNGTSNGDAGSQEFQIYGGVGGAYGPLGAVPTIYNSNQIKTISLSGQTVSTSRNGSVLYTGALSYNTNSGALNIFNDINGANAFQGFIWDVIIIGTSSLPIIAKIEGYLAWKRVLQGSLPVSHAFKNQPPKILS